MTIPTREERLEEEVAGKRKRLIDVVALANTPLSDEQPDVQAFGRGAWGYCRQHVGVHQTGWCSIPAYDKIGLGVDNAKDAYTKCEDWDLKIFDYNK